MVKNTFGGSKAKGFARKNTNVSSNRLRVIEDPSEKFALVTKLYGGSICQVICEDLSYKKAIIRGKFRGKGKRNNIISNGTFVLIGFRDWASDDTVDILEVYSTFELEQLKNKPSFPSHLSQFFDSSISDSQSFVISNISDTYTSHISDISTHDYTISSINHDHIPIHDI
jgi:initiation factor 1A